MRVLHINGNYILTTLHQEMINHLDKTGLENQIFVPIENVGLSTIRTNDNVKVVECIKKRDRFVFDFKQKKIIDCINKNYNVKDFACIHAYTLFTDGNSARELSRKYGVPYVVAVRNTDVNVFFKYMVHLRRRGIKIMHDASAIIFLSEAYKKKVIKKYIPAKFKDEIIKKCYVIPNGIDNFWFDNKFIEKDVASIIRRFEDKRLKLIYAGRIDKNKNIELTLSAIEKLQEDGWIVEFVVVGKVKDESEYLKIKEATYCTYLDARPKEQLLELYRNADIFVMPSHTETFGLVYAEAMSQGLPVIYTKGEGFDKQFNEGIVGYSVNSNDSGELAEKIVEVVRNYSTISSNVINLVEKFQWRKITNEYMDIYRAIVPKLKMEEK